MAKKNYMKLLPKAGSTVAVALAMTVALSTQAHATELEEVDIQNHENPPVDNAGCEVNLDLNNSAPVEHNEAIEQENEETVVQNQETVEKNEQTEQNNEAAVEKNETDTGSALEQPELPEVPAAPEAPVVPDEPELPEVPTAPEAPEIPDVPNTEGMDAEDHNEAAGEYNEKVEDYNDQVGDYNEKVEDYNEKVDDYNDKVDEFEDVVDEYNKEVGEYNEQVDQYNKEVGEYNEKVDEYNDAADAFDQAAQEKYEEELKEAEDQHEAAEDKHEQDLQNQEQNQEAYDQYQQEKDAYDDANSDYQNALDEYEASLNEGNADTAAREKYQQEKAAYDKAHADYQAALEKYNGSVAEHDPGSEEYQKYLQDKAAYDQACADYLAALENYNNVVLPQYEQDSAEYQQYLQDKAAYDKAYAEYLEELYKYNNETLPGHEEKVDQSDKEKEILEDVNKYNNEVAEKNDQIETENAKLEDNIDVGVVESLKDVGEINSNVEIDAGTLSTLGDFENLDADKNALDAAGKALADHSGKDAELGSDAYAAYLKAVEDHNAAVDAFNAKVAAYNEAVAKYNAAVDAFNETQKDSSSTSVGEAENSETADWGNFADDNMSFNHLDVRYDAAAVKKQNGDGTYSNEVSKYDVVGVYYDEAAAKADSEKYGITYTDTKGEEVKYAMVKDNDHAEFGTASKDHNGQIDRTDAEANKNTVVTFYATLSGGGDELKPITVTLDKNSVYADNSYVLYDKGDYLHMYEDSEGNGLNLVQIGEDWYYDVSGKPVFLISALVCDGYSPYGGFFNMGGLDLVLNLQTMIEIHQADSAKKVGFMSYELEKYKAVDENNLSDPGKTPEAPTFEGKEVTPVSDPGKRPDAPTYDPGEFDESRFEAPTATARLEHLSTLEKLEEKVVINFDNLGDIDSFGTLDLMDLIEIEEPVEPHVEPPVDPIVPPVTPTPEQEPVVVDDVFEIDFEIEIPDEEVPLAAAPKTGDISSLWAALSSFSAAGFFLLGRKRKDEE